MLFFTEHSRWLPWVVDMETITGYHVSYVILDLCICDDPWEYMCFSVTLVIMVLLYISHSVWPDPLPGQ